MLQRQKILLSILDRRGLETPRLVFVKLAFLLSQCPDFQNKCAFYDFVPYKYGPFSFTLYRELDALIRNGYVIDADASLAIAPRLSPEVKSTINELDQRVLAAVDQTMRDYQGINQDTLLRETYRRFPWYATASELKDHLPKNLPCPPVAVPAVYTIGYEGKSVDAFFDTLLRRGIRRIIDVRANPLSRKYGFSKNSLNTISSKLGLEYRHFPDMGIDSSLRKGLTNDNAYQRLFDRYEKNILPQRRPTIKILCDLLREKPSALMCFEKDPQCCHRGRLAAALAQESGLKIIHL